MSGFVRGRDSMSDMEEDLPSLPPVALIVANLTGRWDKEEALVVADWCEGHGMYGAARELRKGPSAECRAMCHVLATCFGIGKASQRGDWLPPQRWKILRISPGVAVSANGQEVKEGDWISSKDEIAYSGPDGSVDLGEP